MRLFLTIASDAGRKYQDLQRVHCESFRRPFGTWHQASFYQVLHQNHVDLARQGLPISSIRATAKTHRGQASKTCCLQKMARREIFALTSAYNLEFRIRHKMQRWRFVGPDAIVAARVIRNFRTIGQKCRPCVASAAFRAFWNGWPTTWRMRTMPGAGKVASCLLGCTNAADQIEHYLVCPVAWEVLHNHHAIKLQIGRKSLPAMLLAEKHIEIREVCAIATSIYAIARTVQALRSSDCAATPLLKLHLQEGMRGRANWMAQSQ